MRGPVVAMPPVLLAIAVLAAGLPYAGSLSAQELPPSIRVVGVGEPVEVDVATHRGYAAYPAWTLRALGARVETTTDGVTVVFGADTLTFRAGSPFFHGRDRVWQMLEPAYQQGGVFYLPHQLFVEWLPQHFASAIRYEGGRLAMVGSGPEPAAEARVAGDPGTDTDPEPAAGRPAGAREPVGTPARMPPLVVIDAGHGGRDPGAIGPSGVREKDVVLQVSKRLATVLAERGYDIRMTRTTDTLIALSDRPHMANEWRGNRPGLFLSIHANKVSDRRVRGYETFFLSDARTEDERRVAEMENAAVAYEEPDRVTGEDDLGFIRNNLRNDFYIRASYDLAGLVQDEFGTFHQGRNRGVKQAGFIVLIGAFMPAVLVELAFISNPQEERLLGSGSFQVELAEAMADAVDQFFEQQGGRWAGASP